MIGIHIRGKFGRRLMADVVRLSFAATLMITVALVCPPLAWGQHASGAISGNVVDPGGSVVPNAAVSVIAVDTGMSREVTTNSDGRYAVTNLDIGLYQVKVHMQGFATAVREGINLAIGQQLQADFVLTVGTVTQAINVNASVAAVETETSQVSSLANQSEIQDLPLNGRNYEQLVLLSPGVVTSQATQTTGNNAIYYGRNPSYSVAGSRPSDQSFLLDGQDIQTFWGHGAGNAMTGYSLGVDAIAQFQTITSTYGAQYGGSGAVMSATSKGGTNHFHGSAFDFARNQALDALNYFDSPSTPPTFNRNQFGGSLGGPIQKEKTFFFATYEGLRQTQGDTEISSTLDANAHTGLVNGVQYRINPVMTPYINLYPACTPGGQEYAALGACDYKSVNNTTTSEDYVYGRVDRRLSAADNLFARYNYDNGRVNITLPFSPVAGWPDNDAATNQYFSINETHILNANSVNTLMFNFARTNSHAHSPGQNPLLEFFPGEENGSMDITGFLNLGSTAITPLLHVQNKFEGGDDLNWIKGKHQLLIGVSVQRQQSNFAVPNAAQGHYTFNTLGPLFYAGVPNLLLASPQSGDLPERGFREIKIFPYIEDTWKVSHRLTLNLGLRYEFVTNPTEVNNNLYQILNYQTATGFTHVSNLFSSNPAAKNIDPRIGLVWSPTANNKTSIRAGFGLYSIVIEPREYASNYSNGYPDKFFISIMPSFPVPFQSGITIPTPTEIFGLDYQADTTPYMMQYSLTVERELSSGTVLDVGYVGSVGRHLMVPMDLNPPTAQQQADGTYYVPNPFVRANPNLGAQELSKTIGESSYNSLQVNLKRSMARNLDFQVAYTFSKFEDDGSGSATGYMAGQSDNAISGNNYTLTTEHGLSAYNMKSVLAANVVYMLPFKGNQFVRGWQLSSIVSYNSGVPINVVNGGTGEVDTTFTFPMDRPNLKQAAGCSSNPKVGKVTEWFDTSCFSTPALGYFGDLGRNTVIGPNFREWDFSLAKDFSLTHNEAQKLQFRWDLFNLLNMPNFGVPTGTMALPLFGQITLTVGSSRQMQLSLRFNF